MDRAVTTLIQDLEERGLDQDVLVVVWGEFGRTPKINANGGRDHWADVQSVMLSGGHYRHGQVIGSSNAKGEVPKDRPLWPYDIVATMYHHLGIDPHMTPVTPAGQSIPLLDRGEVIREPVCELKGTVGELRQSVADLKQTVRAQQQTIAELQVEKERLKQQLSDRDRQHPTQRLDEEYSLEAEDKRTGGQRRKKQKSPRRGRRTTAEKLALADRHEDVFSEDVPPDVCTLHLSRVVWRIKNGQAVLVAYHVYHGPGGEVPTIPGTLGRSEYGIEIYLALTFTVFITRLSMDKVCQQLEFFWGLKLAKSQADTQRVLIRGQPLWLSPRSSVIRPGMNNPSMAVAEPTGS